MVSVLTTINRKFYPSKSPSFAQEEFFLENQEQDSIGLLAGITQIILVQGKIIVFPTGTFDQ